MKEDAAAAAVDADDDDDEVQVILHTRTSKLRV